MRASVIFGGTSDRENTSAFAGYRSRSPSLNASERRKKKKLVVVQFFSMPVLIYTTIYTNFSPSLIGVI